MINKKDIALEDILKSSVYKAKVSTGIINEEKKEQERPFVYQPFDPEKHMPKIEIKSKAWETKGTPESENVDQLLSAIVTKGADGLETYKNTIGKLNSVLGIKVGEYGLPIYEEDEVQGATAQEIVSALKTKHIIYSIVFNQSPNVAGKMFEGLAARIVSGRASGITNPIEDVYDEQDNFISLKLLDKTSDIKGSKYNLADGVVRAENKNKKLSYLILLKSTKDDPFTVKTVSFEINRDNYFQLISNRLTKELTPEVIYSYAKSVIDEKLYDDFINSPQTYVTTAGLYNDSNELLAVAKLSRPLLKDFTKEALVRVKLDF